MALSADLLRAAVDPDWLAKTYSEYLLACADDQLDMNNAIVEVVDDDELAEMIDGYREVWDVGVAALDDLARRELVSANLTYDDIKYHSDAYSMMLDAQPSEFWAAAQSIALPIVEKYASYEAGLDDSVRAMDFARNYYYNGSSSDTYLVNEAEILGKINVLSAEVATELHLPSDYKYPLLEGYVDFQSMVSKLILFTNLGDEANQFSMDVQGSVGDSLGSANFVASDIISQLKATAASDIAWALGFSSSAIDDLSDRVTNFTENVKSLYDERYAQASEAFRNVKTILANTKTNVSNFISQAEQMLGLLSLPITNTKLEDTTVASFTGASPYAAMDLHTAKGIASATGAVIASAAVSVWNSMKVVGAKLLNKVRPIVQAVTGDPYDLSVVDNQAPSYQVDKWCYNSPRARIRFHFSTVEERDAWMNKFQTFGEKTVTFDTYFGTLVMSISTVSGSPSGSANVYAIIDYSYRFKPKCIDCDTAIEYSLAAYNSTSNIYTVTDYTSITAEMIDHFVQSGKMYCDDGVDEGKAMIGFQLATALFSVLGVRQFYDLGVQQTGFAGWNGLWQVACATGVNLRDVTYVPFDLTSNAGRWQSLYTFMGQLGIYVDNPDQTHPQYPSSVTNRDFLEMASGYAVRGVAWSGGIPYMFRHASGTPAIPDGFCGLRNAPYDYQTATYDTSGDTRANFDFYSGAFVALLALQTCDRIINPGNFTFIPYSTDYFEFDAPRYAIRTDAQNAQIADVLVSVIVIVAVVATIVLIGWKIGRTIKRSKFKRWEEKKQKLQSQMWGTPDTGFQPLNKSEWRTYLRADRKLSKLNLWSVGTAASSVVSNSLSPDSSLNGLISDLTNGALSTESDYSSNMFLKVRALICGS